MFVIATFVFVIAFTDIFIRHVFVTLDIVITNKSWHVFMINMYFANLMTHVMLFIILCFLPKY